MSGKSLEPAGGGTCAGGAGRRTTLWGPGDRHRGSGWITRLCGRWRGRGCAYGSLGCAITAAAGKRYAYHKSQNQHLGCTSCLRAVPTDTIIFLQTSIRSRCNSAARAEETVLYEKIVLGERCELTLARARTIRLCEYLIPNRVIPDSPNRHSVPFFHGATFQANRVVPSASACRRYGVFTLERRPRAPGLPVHSRHITIQLPTRSSGRRRACPMRCRPRRYNPRSRSVIAVQQLRKCRVMAWPFQRHLP